MICRFQYGSRVLSLPASLQSALATADRLSLCVLLCAADSSFATTEALCAHLQSLGVACSIGQAEEALRFWERSGVLTCEGQTEAGSLPFRQAEQRSRIRSSDLPQYTGVEQAQKLTEAGSRLAFLLEDCQQILKKTLSPSEISRLIALVDFLGIEPDYLRLICTYCVKRGKNAFGYIEKMARNLYAEGVETTAALTVYLDQLQQRHTMEGKVRALCGLGDRAFTRREEEYLRAWTQADLCEELLRLAYDKTVQNTAKPSLSYMNKLLSVWRAEGLTTAQQVQAYLQAQSQKKEREPAPKTTSKKQASPKKEASFSPDEFFSLALERSYRSLEESEDPS